MLVLCAAYPASADLSLDVAPAKLELQISPNTTQTFPITVRNSGTAPLHIQVSLSDFGLTPGGDYVFKKPGSEKFSLSKWLGVNPREFDIPPNTVQQVRVTLNVPGGVNGEYSGIIFFTTRPERHQTRGITFAERVASKIYGYTPASLKIDGAVDGIAVKRTPIGEQFLVGFKNRGNAHLYLNGKIEVRKGDRLIASVPFAPQQLVGRGERRVIEAYVVEKLPPGSYTALALVDFGGPNLAGGQTTFTVK
ncbi:MAG TPA: hypothetical protein VFN49_05680 [Candidatus Aquilonibacter sp.]|nr:hypothetical protein [Candidatus Aquilonibacter sp.]